MLARSPQVVMRVFTPSAGNPIGSFVPIRNSPPSSRTISGVALLPEVTSVERGPTAESSSSCGEPAREAAIRRLAPSHHALSLSDASTPFSPDVCLLLPRHRDAQALLRGDQVVGVLGAFVHVDLHPVDPARERTVFRPVIVADGRGAVTAHVGGLIGGE